MQQYTHTQTETSPLRGDKDWEQFGCWLIVTSSCVLVGVKQAEPQYCPAKLYLMVLGSSFWCFPVKLHQKTPHQSVGVQGIPLGILGRVALAERSET